MVWGCLVVFGKHCNHSNLLDITEVTDLTLQDDMCGAFPVCSSFNGSDPLSMSMRSCVKLAMLLLLFQVNALTHVNLVVVSLPSPVL